MCQTALTDLQNIALKVEITCDTRDKTKRQIKGFITKLYEGIIEDLENTKEEKKKLLLEIIDAINQDKTQNNSENTEQHVENESSTELPKTESETEMKTEEAGGGNLNLLRELGILGKTGLLRKDLKIRGQVGEAGQKGALSYVSLIHQIKNAQQAGYEESEIVSVVIGAMIPSLTLRNVLETISNLSLAQLQKYLQSHYGEQNATDLANNLTSMVQFPSESSYAFVRRCIEMKQKLIMSSDKADIKYDRALIQKLFLRTLERGVLSQMVVQEVKHLLGQDSACDEELLSTCI